MSPNDVEQTDMGSGSGDGTGTGEPNRLDEEEAAEKPAAKPSSPEPVFKEGGSVNEAIQAVPQGAERVNLDQEALGKPLQDPALYEPCKPGASRFKMRIAIWDGKAVGLDVTTTPKNPKLEDCIKERLRGVTWPDKVKSLNTVEYQL